MTADIATALRKAIAASGKSHYALAKESGVASEVIDRFVRGERDIRLQTAARLAKALGLELRAKQDGDRRRGES